MAYVSDSNLTQFWGLAKDYIKAENSRYANWRQTEKAGAVTCWPVGGTQLLPTVDFLFTEAGPASGDKGPDNPSTIAGVENIIVGRCGKNLYNIFETPKYPPALSEPDADGYIDFSVTNTSGSTQYYGRPQKEKSYILSEKTYTIVFEVASISSCAILLNMSSEYSLRGQLNTGYNLINSAGTHFIICSNNNIYAPNVLLRLTLQVLSGATASIKFRVSVFEGIVDSSNFEYVPYSGTDYPLSLNDTYYGGSVDLATGVMTVTHVKVVLTGSEEMPWTVGHNSATTVFSAGAAWRSFIPVPKTPSSGPVCTHFPFLYSGQSDTVHFYVFSAGGAAFWYPDPDMTEAEWKAYLAAQYADGTPVTLCYEVDVPTTVQLSPIEILSLAQTDKYIPRLNTIYTDASAVQVGYAKSPIRSEYELTQAIIATEGGE